MHETFYQLCPACVRVPGSPVFVWNHSCKISGRGLLWVSRPQSVLPLVPCHIYLICLNSSHSTSSSVHYTICQWNFIFSIENEPTAPNSQPQMCRVKRNFTFLPVFHIPRFFLHIVYKLFSPIDYTLYKSLLTLVLHYVISMYATYKWNKVKIHGKD